MSHENNENISNNGGVDDSGHRHPPPPPFTNNVTVGGGGGGPGSNVNDQRPYTNGGSGGGTGIDEDDNNLFSSAKESLVSDNGGGGIASDSSRPTVRSGLTNRHNHNNGDKQQHNTDNSNKKSVSLHLNIDNRRLIDGNNDFSCGIFRWHPKWLQRFANKQTFLALFCLTSVLQGVYYTYFVSVLTTIEKLYQVQSKTTGLIMSSTEIGQISGALLLTYYGGQGHRPRWIATGMLVFAVAALLCSTPHYLFGSKPSMVFSKHEPIVQPPPLLCTLANSNASLICDQESDVVIRRSQVTDYVLGLFFMSLLLIGIGTTAVNTLGIPYIDDNVAPKESPLYFAITIGVRVFGPVCGFLLGSICTSIPVDFPFGSSDLTPTDPNWIGAWWLGLFLVGISLSLTAIPMMIFPRRLPQPDPSSYCHQQQQQSLLEHERLIEQMKSSNGDNDIAKDSELVTFCDSNTISNESNNSKALSLKPAQKDKMIQFRKTKKDTPTLRGFSVALRRLLKNDILLCRTASSVLHILPISGLYTFLPKYLESQFQLTATHANIISGLAGILVMGFGIFTSGTFMRKFKPSARFVACWIAFAALSYVIGMIALMFLGCSTNNFAGFKGTNDLSGEDYFTSANNNSKLECSANCQCPMGRFEPVCMADGITYMSPCIAGCSTLFNSSSAEKFYVDCSCSSFAITEERIAKPGLCPLQCNTLTLYIIIFSVTVLIHSTSEVGSMLLTLRCVEPQDKAMALGFLSFAIGLFGNVPCPILYGAIVDSTCLFWEEDCSGKQGACRVYDSTRFRQLFHGLTAFIMFLAFCIDLAVCYKASGIQFHEEVPAPDIIAKQQPQQQLPEIGQSEEEQDKKKKNGTNISTISSGSDKSPETLLLTPPIANHSADSEC